MSDEFSEKEQQLIALCPEVDNLVFALKQYLNITFFRYVKSYSTHEKFVLCNNEAWLKAYFKEKFYDNELTDFSKHPDDSRGVHIHHHCDKDHPVCNFWNQHGDIGNYNSFIYFFIKFKNYFEAYNFGVQGDTHQTDDTILNNQPIFKHFFLYFKSKGKPLLQKGHECRFPVNIKPGFDVKDNWLVGMTGQMAKIIRLEMPIQEFTLDDEYENISLTMKEARSLGYFLDGYSMLQAAQLLMIDEDRHIDNLESILEKLNLKNYNDLRTLCNEHHIARKLKFLNKDIT